MRTFDEAVDAAFLVKPPGKEQSDSEVQECMERKGASQTAFQQDIMANLVIMHCLDNLCLDLATNMAQKTRTNASGEELAATLTSYLLSAFQWGLTVGRKMEEHDA